MRWLLVLFSFSFHLSAGPFDQIHPSTSDEIASLNTDLLVDGFVSVLSGQISISETDLHIRGAQDLQFKRVYVPPQIQGRYDDKDKVDRWHLGHSLFQLHTKGWVTLPHLWAGYNQNSPYFLLRSPQGYVLEFEVTGNKGVLRNASYGCSNLSGEVPNSSADIRNTELKIEKTEVRIVCPDGTERIYQCQVRDLYRLDHELLPNGKRIQYNYGPEGLARISSMDPNGQYTYAYIDRVGNHHYRSSDSNEVQLTYETRDVN